jgi:hypothetical protein
MSGLRAAGLIAALVGAVGSVYLTLNVGRHGHSVILMGLFVSWDLSPFAALAAVSMIARNWLVLTRATLYVAMLVVTAVSLAIYGTVAFGPPRPHPAFAFLMVPLASWALVAVVVSTTVLLSGSGRKRFHDGQ